MALFTTVAPVPISPKHLMSRPAYSFCQHASRKILRHQAAD